MFCVANVYLYSDIVLSTETEGEGRTKLISKTMHFIKGGHALLIGGARCRLHVGVRISLSTVAPEAAIGAHSILDARDLSVQVCMRVCLCFS